MTRNVIRSGRRLALCLAFAAACHGQVCGDPGDHYEGIPVSVVPVPQKEIYSWLHFDPEQPSDGTQWTGANLPQMRRHGWDIWAALNADSRQPSQGRSLGPMKPKWETWYPAGPVLDASARQPIKSRALFDSNLSMRANLILESPPELAGLPTRETPTGNGTTRVGFVADIAFYNQPTCKQIIKQRLGDPKVKDELYAKGQLNPAVLDSVAFPDPASMALKTLWVQISAKGCDEIPVWDGVPGVRGLGFNPMYVWPRVVAVRTHKGQSCPGENSTVDLDQFYWQAITCDETRSASKSLREHGTATEYRVLVGMHVITKETPDWVWATFWWHDHPDYGPFAADRPATVRGVWRNYLMDIAYDMERPWQANGEPKAIFNPYLEAQLFDGTRSNCMTCHRRSVWPTTTDPIVTTNLLRTALDIRQIVVTGREAATATYLPEYEKSLRLSFLWTLTRQLDSTQPIPSCPR